VVEFEKLPSESLRGYVLKINITYQCSAMPVKLKQRPNNELNAHCCFPQHSYCQMHLAAEHRIVVGLTYFSIIDLIVKVPFISRDKPIAKKPPEIIISVKFAQS
jgi:hypothetical protein